MQKTEFRYILSIPKWYLNNLQNHHRIDFILHGLDQVSIFIILILPVF